jgi:hypothetical protein
VLATGLAGWVPCRVRFVLDDKDNPGSAPIICVSCSELLVRDVKELVDALAVSKEALDKGTKLQFSGDAPPAHVCR